MVKVRAVCHVDAVVAFPERGPLNWVAVIWPPNVTVFDAAVTLIYDEPSYQACLKLLVTPVSLTPYQCILENEVASLRPSTRWYAPFGDNQNWGIAPPNLNVPVNVFTPLILWLPVVRITVESTEMVLLAVRFPIVLIPLPPVSVLSARTASVVAVAWVPIRILPSTCNLSVGEVVPIPTLPFDRILNAVKAVPLERTDRCNCPDVPVVVVSRNALIHALWCCPSLAAVESPSWA